MAELLAPPDAEAVVVAGLSSALSDRGDSAHVGTKVPNPRPPRLVRVSRTGGRRQDLVTDAAQLTFECWDATAPDASDFCRLVYALVWAMQQSYVGGAWVRSVTEVGGPVFFPDPETDLPRYQFTASVDMRMEKL